MRDRWSAVLAVSGRRGPRNAWNTRIGRDPGRASDRRVARPGWGALRRYIPAYLSRVAPLSRRTRPPVAVAQAPDAEEPGLPAASVPWRARPTSPAVPGAGPGITPVGGPILGLLGTVPGVAVVPGPTPEVDGEVEVARPPPGVPVLAAPPAAPPALPALLAPPPAPPPPPPTHWAKASGAFARSSMAARADNDLRCMIVSMISGGKRPLFP